MEPLAIIGLPAFADNYIWVLRRGPNVAVVDPGDATPLLEYLDTSGTRLCAILVTHHHNDHVGGIDAIVARRRVPVYGPAAEAIPGVDHPLADGDVVSLNELAVEFTVLAVPGHTRGHIAFYRPGTLLCGDTLFGAGCGRLFEGSSQQMQASLARLAALPGDTQVYCAHEYTQGNLSFASAVEPNSIAVQLRSEECAALRNRGEPTVPSTLATERATNPFLRWDAPAVIAATKSRLGRQPADPVEVFAALREWKNRF